MIAGRDEGRAWYDVLAEHVGILEHEISRTQAAKAFLEHSLTCPRPNPITDCPVLAEQVHERVAGAAGPSTPTA